MASTRKTSSCLTNDIRLFKIAICSLLMTLAIASEQCECAAIPQPTESSTPLPGDGACATRLRTLPVMSAEQIANLRQCFGITCTRMRGVETIEDVDNRKTVHHNLPFPLVSKSATWWYKRETVQYRSPRTIYRAQCQSQFGTPQKECSNALPNRQDRKVKYLLNCSDGRKRQLKTTIQVEYSCSCYDL